MITSEEKNIYFEKYNNQIHRIGRVGLIVFLSLTIGIPFMMGAILGAMPDAKSVAAGLMKIIPIYLPSCVVEFLIYVPMLGAGGSYLAFVTGNLSNLKIPCAVTASEIANTKAGTPENEIVSTLSIAVSSLVTTLVVFLGVVLIAPLQPILQNPVLIPAFNNVVPALFGALGFKYIKKSLKLSVLPVTVMIILYILLPSLIKQNSMMIIPAGAIALAVGYILYKKNKLIIK